MLSSRLAPAVFQPLLEENNNFNRKFEPQNVTGKNSDGRNITVNVNNIAAYMGHERASLVRLMRIPTGDIKTRIIQLALKIIDQEKDAMASSHNTRDKLDEVDLSKRMCLEIMKHHRVDHQIRASLS